MRLRQVNLKQFSKEEGCFCYKEDEYEKTSIYNLAHSCYWFNLHN
jgi:hypothetical protein